uniref:Uncharacterized protein n=1 Tax=Setaria italica TaxID=4555 RepID=K3XU74_SETIT
MNTLRLTCLGWMDTSKLRTCCGLNNGCKF